MKKLSAVTMMMVQEFVVLDEFLGFYGDRLRGHLLKQGIYFTHYRSTRGSEILLSSAGKDNRPIPIPITHLPHYSKLTLIRAIAEAMLSETKELDSERSKTRGIKKGHRL